MAVSLRPMATRQVASFDRDVLSESPPLAEVLRRRRSWEMVTLKSSRSRITCQEKLCRSSSGHTSARSRIPYEKCCGTNFRVNTQDGSHNVVTWYVLMNERLNDHRQTTHQSRTQTPRVEPGNGNVHRRLSEIPGVAKYLLSPRNCGIIAHARETSPKCRYRGRADASGLAPADAYVGECRYRPPPIVTVRAHRVHRPIYADNNTNANITDYADQLACIAPGQHSVPRVVVHLLLSHSPTSHYVGRRRSPEWILPVTPTTGDAAQGLNGPSRVAPRRRSVEFARINQVECIVFREDR